MSELFEPAFLERQQATHPDLDVRVYAAAVAEMNSRRPVRNPNGLLVHWLERAEKTMGVRRARTAAADAAELDRYAVLWVELLRLTSTRSLSPIEVARCLDAARSDQFPKLNARLVARLTALGQAWDANPKERAADQTRRLEAC